MTQANTSTGPGNIQKFEITSNKSGEKKDISAGVVDYRYYESVISNLYTASAVVVESGNDEKGGAKGILDSLPIRGGEVTEIIIEDPSGNQLRLQEPMYVNRVKDGIPGTQQDVYVLDFVPKEHYLNNQNGVKERYEGNIKDNFVDIMTNVLKTNLPIEADDTGLEMNFYGNGKKPFYMGTFLASKSVPTKGIDKLGGFLFYMTRDGFKFKAIDNLFDQEPVKKYIFNNTSDLPEGYDEKIVSYKIGEDIDFEKNLNIGAYHLKSTFFDFYKMEFKETQLKIDDQESEANTAGKDFVTANQEFWEKPTRGISIIKDYGVNFKGEGDEQLENFKQDDEKENFKSEKSTVQTIMRYNQMFTVKTEVMIPCDLSLKAGDIIECTFPDVESVKNKEDNKQTGGKYLVADICHRLTPEDSFTKMNLVRDSYGKQGGF